MFRIVVLVGLVAAGVSWSADKPEPLLWPLDNGGWMIKYGEKAELKVWVKESGGEYKVMQSTTGDAPKMPTHPQSKIPTGFVWVPADNGNGPYWIPMPAKGEWGDWIKLTGVEKWTWHDGVAYVGTRKATELLEVYEGKRKVILPTPAPVVRLVPPPAPASAPPGYTLVWDGSKWVYCSGST